MLKTFRNVRFEIYKVTKVVITNYVINHLYILYVSFIDNIQPSYFGFVIASIHQVLFDFEFFVVFL